MGTHEDRTHQPEHADAGNGQTPSADVGQRSGHQTSTHPAQGGATDVRPVARAMALGATSSRRYATATAGSPATANPNRPRKANSEPHVGAATHATAITEAPNNEIIMTLVRPMTSLIGPTKSSAIPRVRVVTLTDSAADPAVTPKCVLSRGEQWLSRVELGERRQTGSEQGPRHTSVSTSTWLEPFVTAHDGSR